MLVGLIKGFLLGAVLWAIVMSGGF